MNVASPPRLLLVTGTLAEPATRQVAAELVDGGLAAAEVQVLTIQVAALMTTDWLARKLERPAGEPVDRVILPGYCRGELAELEQKLGVAVERGPENVRDLPRWLGGDEFDPADGGAHELEIIAEINHAPRLERERMLEMAAAHAAAGADVIDVGCDPGADREPWPGAADAVRALRDAGHRVSIDTFHPGEAAAACAAGAELVLSVNAANAARAADWGAEVVVIPENPKELAGLDAAVERLEADGTPYRIDPVIEPIGFGFAESLGRYLETRRRYPEAEIMMGIGNLTEMTEVDSAGVNMLLVGFCREQGIRSVLTTQVINWARSAVAEIDVARRIVHEAVRRGAPPKHLSGKLVMLRDETVRSIPAAELDRLAGDLTDSNVRIFASHETGAVHAMNRDVHARGADPFEVFDELGVEEPSHAFYLGWEMAKAALALHLGKHYEQDEALDWGLLTRPEKNRHRRRKRKKRGG